MPFASLYKKPSCHKTLFGNVDMERIIHWAKYHYDLGFDDVFIWYIPEMQNHSGFSKLQQLPYVTLLPNTVGKPRRYPNGYLRMNRDAPGSQLDCEKWCLREAAVHHGWVLWADADEFLWFNESLGVHEFTEAYGRNNTWLSFGKWMYTLNHAVETKNDKILYGLSGVSTGCYSSHEQ